MTMQPFKAPPGYRFCPTDQELVGNYLLKKLTNTLLPIESLIINDCDLYGNEEPWQVWQRFGGSDDHDDLYFFTELKKKTKGSRFDRSVGIGGGSWHGEDSGKEIVAQVKINDQWVYVEAIKRRFNYRNKKSHHHCRWIMHEYCLPKFSTELVLCRLRNNYPKEEKGVSVIGSSAKEKGMKRKLDEGSVNVDSANLSKRVRADEEEDNVSVINSNNVLPPEVEVSAEGNGLILCDNFSGDDYFDDTADKEWTLLMSGICDGSMGPGFTIDELFGDLQSQSLGDENNISYHMNSQTLLNSDFDSAMPFL